jgi:hypothetical protein
MEMNMKPSDLFVGVIDFFSTLVPGAIAAFFLSSEMPTPAGWPSIEHGSAEGWVVFAVVAYVLGHLIAAVGSALLDPLYDRVYVRWRRASSRYVASKLPPDASPWTVFVVRVGHVVGKSNPDDELLIAAKALKKQQLTEMAGSANVRAGGISNTFWWAGTVVRMQTPPGAAEVDALTAQSKLFRSVVLLVPLAAFSTGWYRSSEISIWVVVLLLSLWRFMGLRWGATERTYEYYLATAVLRPQGRADGQTA